MRAMKSEQKQKDFREGGAIIKHLDKNYINMRHNENDHLPLNRFHGGRKMVK